jgi:hypothetical protein
MSIIKEYYQKQIDMRGPDNPKAKPMVTGTVSILRHDDGKPLTIPRAAALFNEAAKDFPAVDAAKVRIVDDHLEVSAKPPAGYTPLPPHFTGARG